MGTEIINSGDTDALLRHAGLLPEAEKPEHVQETAKVDADEAEPAKETAEIEHDEENDFAKRHNLTKEQHEAWTKTVKKAVDKQYRGRKEAEEFATFQYNQAKLAEERAERLERELARLKTESAPPVKEEGPPNRQDFADDSAYQEAMIDYRVDQKLKKQAEDQRRQNEEAERQRAANEAKQRVERAAELVPDYMQVVSGADIAVPPHIAGYMQESDMIAELGYHFAKNPDALDKLSKLTPAKALVELGKIESKLVPFGQKTESSKSAPAQPSTAPKPSEEAKRIESPIVPLSSGTRAQVKKDPSEMTYQDALEDFQRRTGRTFSARKRH